MDTDYLGFLHTILEAYYKLYKAEKITEKEYLYYIKPIDKAIDRIELGICRKILILNRVELENEREIGTPSKKDAQVLVNCNFYSSTFPELTYLQNPIN